MWLALAPRIWKNILRYMANPSSVPGKFKGLMVPSNPGMEVQKISEENKSPFSFGKHYLHSSQAKL